MKRRERGLLGAGPSPAIDTARVDGGAGETTPANVNDWFGVEGHLSGARVVYPQALPRTRDDGSGGLVTRWDLHGDADTSFFDAELAELVEAYCVDRMRVFVTGFSSGGNFSQQLACVCSADDRADEALPVADARSSRDFWSTQNGCGPLQSL